MVNQNEQASQLRAAPMLQREAVQSRVKNEVFVMIAEEPWGGDRGECWEELPNMMC
jgi:hypothetical protein